MFPRGLPVEPGDYLGICFEGLPYDLSLATRRPEAWDTPRPYAPDIYFHYPSTLHYLLRRRFQTLKADQTLRLGLALLPSMVARMAREAVVEAVTFSPDGEWLAPRNNNAARVWRLREGLWNEACARLPRNLAKDEWRRCLHKDLYREARTNPP